MPDVQLNAQSLVTSSATTSPASGTSETWTVTALAAGIPALSSNFTYALVDATSGASSSQQAEIVRVTACAGPGATSITVTRGADNTTPVAHASSSTWNVVIVASAVPPLPLPSYAPAVVLNNWNPRSSTYNNRNENMHSVRSKLAEFANNTASVNVGILSDSTMIGYNGSIYDRTQSIPMRLAQALARKAGNPYYTTGWHWAGAANGGAGDRWATTGTWSSAGGCLVNTTAATATLTTTEACTDVYVAYSNLSSAFSYTVDGGSSTNVTPTGANSGGILHITGLAYGVHVVKLTFAASLGVIAAQRWATPSLNQLHMHNLGFGGANANGGPVNGVNWSSLTSTSPQGLGYVYQTLLTAASLTFDLAIIGIGSNDLNQGATDATIKTGIETMLGSSYIGTAQPFLIHEMPVLGASLTYYNALAADFISLADEHDCPMFDWNDYANNPTGSYYPNDAQAGADHIHPIYSHQNLIGSLLADEIAGHDLYVGGLSIPNLAGIPGGRYKLIESGGVYPLRPPVPAGWCDYVGADAPTDSMPGDSWLDT